MQEIFIVSQEKMELEKQCFLNAYAASAPAQKEQYWLTGSHSGLQPVYLELWVC